jgi:ubiquinone/menaquinone biosynthesis C-methylase UbiE
MKRLFHAVATPPGGGIRLDDKEVGRMWDENAEVWTKLSRMGLNIYHDEFNAPAFLSILPDVKDLEGLDIGCGEGTDTRLLAKRGAQMTAIDVSEKFIIYAKEAEDREPLGIRYQVASVWSIPFPDGRFDFASATMSLMDIPQPERAIKEIFRVLKPRGFLQFSITHPCFDTPYKKWVDDANGKHVAAVVGDYFKEMDGEIEEWIFSFTPSEVKEKLRKFRIPRFTRTLSSWFNTLVDAGFIIERVLEPTASDETINHFPHLEDTRIISHFLIVRCRKPRD